MGGVSGGYKNTLPNLLHYTAGKSLSVEDEATVARSQHGCYIVLYIFYFIQTCS